MLTLKKICIVEYHKIHKIGMKAHKFLYILNMSEQNNIKEEKLVKTEASKQSKKTQKLNIYIKTNPSR